MRVDPWVAAGCALSLLGLGASAAFAYVVYLDWKDIRG